MAVKYIVKAKSIVSTGDMLITETDDYDVMRRAVIAHIMNVIMNEVGIRTNYHASLTDFSIIRSKYPHVYNIVDSYVNDLLTPLNDNDEIIDDEYGLTISSFE